MKLNSNFFVLAAFLCACFVANSFAAGVFGFKCENEQDELFPSAFTKVCYIGQYSSEGMAVIEGFSAGNVYGAWSGDNGFQKNLNDGIVDAMQSCNGDNSCYGFELRLGTDFDLGGFEVSGSDTVCVTEFAPILIPSDVLTNFVAEINGYGKTITGYCDIGAKNRSFFRGVENYGTNTQKVGILQNASIYNLRFDGAYVKSTDYDAYAAVVVAAAALVNFDRITIENSKVISDQVAGGIVAVDSFPVTTPAPDMSFKVSNSHVDVELDGKLVAGGIIGQMVFQKGTGTFDSNTVSVKFRDAAASGAVGGLVGSVMRSGNTDDVNAKSNGDNVTLDFEALASNSDRLYVGGGFGMVQLAKRINVMNGVFDVRISAAGTGEQYFGGLVGRARMAESGGISAIANQMEVAIASTGTGRIPVAMGGLVGHATEYNSNDVNTSRGIGITSDENVLTVSMESASTGDIYAGGLVGYAVAEQGNSRPNGGLYSTATVVKAPEGTNLVTVSSSVVNHLYAGGLAGLFLSPRGQFEVRRAYVEGDIDASVANIRDTSAVGGLFGEISSYRTFIYDNKSVGDILADVDKAGFVIGAFYAETDDSYPIEMYANLHYGTKDAGVEKVFSVMELGGTSVTDWDKGPGTSGDYKYIVSYNYRNAIESGTATLLPTGRLDLRGDGSIKKEVPDGQGGNTVEQVMDGVLDDSTMSSRLLTYVLSKKSADIFPVMNQQSEVLDSSWGGNATLFCWENESGEVPHLCENESDTRTANQIVIDLTPIQSELHDSDFVQLEPYLDTLVGNITTIRLITYTEKDGRLNKDFVQRVKTRSVDFSVLDNTFAVDLENTTFSSDLTYSTDENATFTVVYEIDDGTGNYVSIDDPTLGPVYIWPKVTEFSKYGSHAVVPPIFMTSDSLQNEYYVELAYMPCSEGSVCPTNELSTNPSGDFQMFSNLMGDLLPQYVPDYGTVLHLVYVKRDEKTPRVTVANGSARAGFTLYEYGDIDGQFDIFDSVYASTASGLQMPRLASAYSAAIDIGFELNGWTVDFWAFAQGSPDEMESCYSDFPAAECATVKTVTATENYFADPVTIYYAMEDGARSAAASNGGRLKWSLDVAPDGKFYMDSVISAIAMTEKGQWAGQYQYHLHITPDVIAIPYTINFDPNTDYPVFVAGNTDTLVIYSRESEQTAKLPDLYSTTACFAGWSPDANRSSNYDTLSSKLLEKVSPVDNVFSLYGSWFPEGDVDCMKGVSIPTAQLALQIEGGNGSDYGDVYLWQQLINPNDNNLVFRHDFEDGELNVPNENEFFRFHVGAAPKPGYALDALTLSWMSEDGNPDSTVIYVDGDPMFELNPATMQNVLLRAAFAEVIYVQFVLNKDDDDVFYDFNFTLGDSLEVRNSDAQIEVPAYVYTADACMEGWAYTPDAESFDVWTMTQGNTVYDSLYQTRKLYAVWRDAQTCIDKWEYVPVTAEAENGSITLVETFADGTKRIHKFGEDGRLILPPARGRGEIRVYAEPASGYALESIEMVENGKSGTIEDGTLISFGTEGIELRANFVESNEPVEEDGPVLLTSGNAVKFRFIGRKFVQASGAQVYFVLEGENGFKQDTTYECGSFGCQIWWEWYPLKGGHYSFKAQMFDGVDSSMFEREFDVATEIAAGESWHMVSLANVDLAQVDWENDVKMYMWNETLNYGRYWQYQELTQKGTPDQLLGYWYNSLEGKPLQLNDSAFTDDIEWTIDSVFTGWNLLANPYGWYVKLGVDYVDTAKVLQWLEEERQNRGEELDPEWVEYEMSLWLAPPSVEFWRWDEEQGQYVQADTLKPYEAVWAKVNVAEMRSWQLNAKPVYVDTLYAAGEVRQARSLNRLLPKGLMRSAGASLAKSAKGAGWMLRAMLSDAKGKQDSWNFVGAGLRAWNSEEPPPGMGDHVNLSILDGGKRLTKSVKVAGDGAGYEWTVELSATSTRKGYLEFEGLDGLLGKGLHAYLTLDGKTQEIHAGEKTPVDLTSGAKVATLRVAPASKRVVAGELRGLRVASSGSSLQVSFDAAGLGGAKARVDVFDTKGSVIASASLRAVDGVNAVPLEMPRRGLYTVRVAVAGQVAVQRVLFR